MEPIFCIRPPFISSKSHKTASILYPSITTRLRRLPVNFLAPRSFDRSCVAKFFRRREIFFVATKICFVRAKICEKKVWTDTINSVQKSWKSESSSRFLSQLKIENSLLGEFSRSSRDSLHYTPPSGTNLGTIGRTRQKVA